VSLRVPTPSDLLDLADRALDPTGWVEVDAARLDEFTRATGDPDHTYLGLSLVNLFLPDLVAVDAFSSGVNVGLERVELGEPVRAGDRLRAAGRVLTAAEAGGGVQIVVRVTVEAEGRDAPVCTADTVSRFYP